LYEDIDGVLRPARPGPELLTTTQALNPLSADRAHIKRRAAFVCVSRRCTGYIGPVNRRSGDWRPTDLQYPAAAFPVRQPCDLATAGLIGIDGAPLSVSYRNVQTADSDDLPGELGHMFVKLLYTR
jgi:hypothetical protein